MHQATKAMTLAAVLAAAAFNHAVASDFPTRPIRVIMPYPPGTGPDTVMRQVGERLATELKTQVIIDNRAGGNGWIAAEAAKRAKPDGYTLFLSDSTLVSLHQHLYKKLPYDPEKDFSSVAALYSTYYYVTVSAESKWKSVSDLVAAAKANPGKVTYGSSGNGGNLHLGGAMMEQAAGIKMTHIPYKETAQIYVDINRGEIDWAVGTGSTTAPLYQAKKLKYLAITAPQRSATQPDVPTLHEVLGASGYDLQTWVALFAPRGTPVELIGRINTAVQKVLEQPEMRKQLENVGFEPFVQTPEQLAATVKKQSDQYADFVRKLNISLD